MIAQIANNSITVIFPTIFFIFIFKKAKIIAGRSKSQSHKDVRLEDSIITQIRDCLNEKV